MTRHEFYAYANNKKPIKARVNPLKNAKWKLVDNNKEINLILNKFYFSVFTKESGA